MKTLSKRLNLSYLILFILTLTGCANSVNLADTSGTAGALQKAPQSAVAQATGNVTGASSLPSSNGLVGLLMQQLGVTQAQAEGGTGALLQLAQSKMSPGDFTNLGNSIPNMQSIMAAAPSMNTSGLNVPKSLAGMTGGNLPGTSDMLGIAGAFQQLGLAPDMVQKFIPIITQFVQGNGGSAVTSALQSALMGGL